MQDNNARLPLIINLDINLLTQVMCDQAQHLQLSPKHLISHLILSAAIGYIGWKTVETLLFSSDPAASRFNMFRWLSTSCRKSEPKLLEDPEEIYSVKLIEKEQVSHDTRRFRFGLPSDKHVLGLPIGQHVSFIATINDEQVTKSYTPVSSDDDKGYVEFVIKIYFKGVHPKFPNGGRMTQHLESLNIGDSINIRGPKGRLQYHGKGHFEIKENKDEPAVKKQVKRVSMIAGGTGVAPMLQLIRDVLKKSDADKTEIALLFANQSENDILLRAEIEEQAAKYPGQFKFWYTIDRASEGWKYSTGFVNKDMIKEHLHPADAETLMVMCGPPPMISFVQSQLDELEYPKENRFKY